MEPENAALQAEVVVGGAREEHELLDDVELMMSMESDASDSGNDENHVSATFGSLSEGLIRQLFGEVWPITFILTSTFNFTLIKLFYLFHFSFYLSCSS